MSFDAIVDLPKAVYEYGARSSGEAHGVVLTKPHVVSLILDLAGYTVDRDLTSLSLLGPACGLGAFLAPAVERLLSVADRLEVDMVASLVSLAPFASHPSGSECSAGLAQ